MYTLHHIHPPHSIPSLAILVVGKKERMKSAAKRQQQKVKQWLPRKSVSQFVGWFFFWSSAEEFNSLELDLFGACEVSYAKARARDQEMRKSRQVFFCFKFNELLAVRLWLSRWVCELPKTRLTSAWLYVRLDLKNGIGIFSEMIKETERSYRTQRADGVGFQRKFNRIALTSMTKWKNFLRYRQASDDVSVQRKNSLVMNGLCAERFGRIPTTFSFALRDTSTTHQRWVSETRH